MKNTRKKSHIPFLLISSTILLFFFFFLMLGNLVYAEAGNMKEMKSYEAILVKEGDTLSSVAATYANVYSCFSKEDYQEAIISLNSLSSEYIQSGSYLLLPQY